MASVMAVGGRSALGRGRSRGFEVQRHTLIFHQDGAKVHTHLRIIISTNALITLVVEKQAEHYQ